MTFARVLIMIVLVSVFAFTLYKLIMQIKEYKKRKNLVPDENSNKTENNNKEV